MLKPSEASKMAKKQGKTAKIKAIIGNYSRGRVTLQKLKISSRPLRFSKENENLNRIHARLTFKSALSILVERIELENQPSGRFQGR